MACALSGPIVYALFSCVPKVETGKQGVIVKGVFSLEESA